MTISLPMCSIDFMDTSISPEEQAIAERITELKKILGSEQFEEIIRVLYELGISVYENADKRTKPEGEEGRDCRDKG